MEILERKSRTKLEKLFLLSFHVGRGRMQHLLRFTEGLLRIHRV